MIINYNCYYIITYYRDILAVLMEQSTHIRTKALKCMTNIVTEDPEVLFRKDMQVRMDGNLPNSSQSL